MTDSQMDAPERIWVIPDVSGVKHEWHSGWYQGRPNARHTIPYILATPEALAASPEVQALMQPDADLLLDAYRALLVLHRVLDKAGLTRGAETAENIADRIVAAHPEIPARSAIRAEAAAIRGETP